ncbi:hypothetical protein CXK97_12760, partial [Stutzerimonas stutzeri]
SNSPSVQPLIFANFLIYKRFRLRPAPEKVRIIGAMILPSTVVLSFLENYLAYIYVRSGSWRGAVSPDRLR